MPIMNTHEIIHELHRKYENTYVFAEVKDNKESLVHVDRLRAVGEGLNATGEIEMNSADYGVLRFVIPNSQRIVVRHPNYGTFQDGRRAYLIQRKPARQWRRGLCSDNIVLDSVDMSIGGFPSNQLLSLRLLKAAFDGVKHTPSEALEMLGKKAKPAVSVALEGCWSMVQHPVKEGGVYLLMYKTIPVCDVTDDGRMGAGIYNPMFANKAQQWFN